MRQILDLIGRVRSLKKRYKACKEWILVVLLTFEDCSTTTVKQHINQGLERCPHLHPLLKLFTVTKDFHAGLGVGVVCRLEAQGRQSKAREELVEDTDEVAQC